MGILGNTDIAYAEMVIVLLYIVDEDQPNSAPVEAGVKTSEIRGWPC